MKRIVIVVVSVMMVTALVLGASIAMAAKPPHAGEGNQLIPRPNGFPAGPHYNLNIHGKKADFNCSDVTPGGGSVFVPEYGPATIEYVSNKKKSLTELVALDPCAGFDGDPAKVQLPYEAEGYYVFGRILGKPDHGKDCTDPTCPSEIILYPNVVIQACNDTDPANPDFPDYTECPDDPLLALGLIVRQDVYVADNETYVRFEPGVTRGKGKSRATNITRLFTWSGWVCNASLDTSGDGVIDEQDVPIEYDLLSNGGNGNSVIDPEELQNWLADQALAGLCTKYDDVWIFNIADLVVTGQDLDNDGTKLLQIRFYPVDGTTFEE